MYVCIIEYYKRYVQKELYNFESLHKFNQRTDSEDGGGMLLRNIGCAFSGLHGIVSLKIELFVKILRF
jgi:hypothetical protein